MTTQVWWFVARSSGLVATALLTLTVLAGVLLAGRLSGRRPGAAWVLDVHRGVAAVGLAAIGVHAAALVADSYVHIAAAELLVPLASSWRPYPVAAGVVAMWLLVVVQATSLVRGRTLLGRKLSHRAWRRIHWLSFVAWAAAVGHTVTAGTDTLRLDVGSIGAGATGAVLFATWVRWTHRRCRRPPGRPGSTRRPDPRPATAGRPVTGTVAAASDAPASPGDGAPPRPAAAPGRGGWAASG